MNNKIKEKVFVLCCKEGMYIERCVESIRKFHLDHIIIVDSASKDKSYMERILNKYDNVIIEDIDNKNYEYGSIMHSFLKYKDQYKIFIFMQDAMFLNDSGLSLAGLDENSALVFTRIRNDASLSRIFNFAPGLINKAKFPELVETKHRVHMCQYNSFIIHSNTFNKVVQSRLFEVVAKKPPVDKEDSMRWERIWTVLLASNNIKIKILESLDNLNKVWGGRQ